MVDITRRSILGASVAMMLLASARAVGKLGGPKPRIALVFGIPPSAEISGTDPVNPKARAIVRQLRDLGLVDGRNVVIERRSAEGKGPARMAALIDEVVAMDVDVIVTSGAGVWTAKKATSRIPIVGLLDDPVDAGMIDSLSRPGGNLTGYGAVGVTGKEMQLLKEIAASISRVAVIAGSAAPSSGSDFRAGMESAARGLWLNLQWHGVREPRDYDEVFAAIARQGADALVATPTQVNIAHRRRIADFALANRLPSSGFADAGSLLHYGYDLVEAHRRLAIYAAKILEGTVPGNLPWMQPTNYALTINLGTAAALRLAIPPSVLLRAEEVIR
ncbi:MAG: ABC transporter substrate-binding protein [Lysobacter sp.]|nr:ABC transporter substrate-binding protein [Lysobacter sp.]